MQIFCSTSDSPQQQKQHEQTETKSRDTHIKNRDRDAEGCVQGSIAAAQSPVTCSLLMNINAIMWCMVGIKFESLRHCT